LQFGRDGKVTGSIQKLTGKVTLQMNLTNLGIVTSFTVNLMMTHGGELVGTFSGCEISKTAANVAGSFRAVKGARSVSGDGSSADAGAGGAGGGEGAGAGAGGADLAADGDAAASAVGAPAPPETASSEPS
jgi:hypothetical protein